MGRSGRVEQGDNERTDMENKWETWSWFVLQIADLRANKRVFRVAKKYMLFLQNYQEIGTTITTNELPTAFSHCQPKSLCDYQDLMALTLYNFIVPAKCENKRRSNLSNSQQMLDGP